eukprot:CAMPEP_0184014430 /NCGR_PEP_ID=MMETSP0954-20121128/5652_1 /TAXON_ID=627963 /ORGANISM="Aplanochytrium sp, Strain PBS07" /LENGTH=173 /DNA_ID=CAMNT_0026294905 /DNA_START=478 /DNA_END=999 /DNA_ORIENTATION=-
MAQKKSDDNTKPKFKTGWWDKTEHNLFLQGLHLHGRNWKRISQLVQTRSPVQTRTHAQKFFLKMKKENFYPLETSGTKRSLEVESYEPTKKLKSEDGRCLNLNPPVEDCCKNENLSSNGLFQKTRICSDANLEDPFNHVLSIFEAELYSAENQVSCQQEDMPSYDIDEVLYAF